MMCIDKSSRLLVCVQGIYVNIALYLSFVMIVE